MDIFVNQGKDSTIEPSYLSKTFSDKSGGPILIHKNINENGNYSALADGIDGYSSVIVEVSPTLENKTVTPITSEQTITAGENYEGLGTVTVEAVTSAIDANITAGNIKKDVQILGVTGSYEGSGGGGNATLETEGSEFNYTGDYATLLTAITLPGSVTSIGDYAFNGCTSLTNIDLQGITYIGEGAFYECSSLTSIIIPGSVTSIGDYAFQGCIGLTSVTISDGVENMGDTTFTGCSSLTSIIIPGSVTRVGTTAFRECSSLASVTISDGVESIGDSAFDECTSLTSINIPGSVTSIGEGAFYGCSSLISIIIPDGVERIGIDAFGECSNLTTITIHKAEGSIAGAPWGATNATVVWNGE